MYIMPTELRRTTALARLYLAALFLLLTVVVSAGERPAVMAQTDWPDSILAKGIGTGVRGALSAATRDYDLKLAFASKSTSALVAYATVQICDARGKEVLHTDNAGPRFFTNLPNGIYRVTATAYGRAIEQTARIRNGEQTELSFYW